MKVAAIIVRAWMIFSGYHRFFLSHSANSSNSKRKGSDERDASQSSGSSGKRNFVRSWTKDFPWLKYDGEKMRCRPCCSRTTESDSSSVFVTGSTFASMQAVCLFLRARAVINFIMRAASTLEITNMASSEHFVYVSPAGISFY